MKVTIRSIIGVSTAVTFDFGVKVREYYGDVWQKEPIVLDFEGIRNVSPSFLSQAASPMLRELDANLLPERIAFENVPTGFESTWNAVCGAATRLRAK